MEHSVPECRKRRVLLACSRTGLWHEHEHVIQLQDVDARKSAAQDFHHAVGGDIGRGLKLGDNISLVDAQHAVVLFNNSVSQPGNIDVRACLRQVSGRFIQTSRDGGGRRDGRLGIGGLSSDGSCCLGRDTVVSRRHEHRADDRRQLHEGCQNADSNTNDQSGCADTLHCGIHRLFLQGLLSYSDKWSIFET